MPVRIIILCICVGVSIYIFLDAKKRGLPLRLCFFLFSASLIFPINLFIIPVYLIFGRQILATVNSFSNSENRQGNSFNICSKCGVDNPTTQKKCSKCGNVLNVKE